MIEQYTRSRVLTEERVQGRRASEVADLSATRRAAISRRIVRFVVVSALVHGFFYGDPHPGNLLVKDDGSLSVIDFGKVGRLTPDQRRHVIDIFLAIARSDGRHLTDALLQVTTQAHPVDRAMIESEVEQLLELYAGLSLGKVQIGDALGELLELVRRLGVRVLAGTDVTGSIPREVALLAQMGLDPKDALAAASTWPRRFLGAPATADTVTYHHDPRQDPGQLARPAAVVAGGIRLR